MVQEYVSPVRVHKYSFEMVMAAYERRFPSCPQIPVVVECVITEDSWSADDSQRHTIRRCQLNVDAPYLLKKMIGVDYIYFTQKNHLDLKARVLEIEATNETFSSRVGVVEKCKYYVHPENSEWTCFEQSALLDVKNFFGLENTVEKIAMKQYASNIAKGKELIESFMTGVLADGVTELKAWSEEDAESNRELRRIVSRGTEPLSPRPVEEIRKHSQPGPSISRTNIVTPKSSSRRNKLFKSNLKCSPETSKKMVSQSRSDVKISSTDLKKSNMIRNSSHLLMGKQNTAEKVKAQSLKATAKSSEDVRLTKRKVEEKIKKKAVSHSDLTNSHNHNSGLDDAEPVVSKPCVCEQRIQVNVADLFTRWDNLLVVLVCSFLIVILFSTSLSFFLPRTGRR